jgi:hypothetical protein
MMASRNNPMNWLTYLLFFLDIGVVVLVIWWAVFVRGVK